MFNEYGDCGHCGLYNDVDCLYKDFADDLRIAISSGEPFDTGWHGFKKELESMKVTRKSKNDDIIVEVSAYMDSAYEDAALIYDCLTNEESKNLTDSMIEEIRNELDFTDFREETEEMEFISPESSLEDVIKTASDLIRYCNNELHECYLMCMEVTLSVLYNHPEDMTFIYERIEKAR